MTDMRRNLATAATAYRRFVREAQGADRSTATRLAGWTVGDLIDHVAWAAAMEADAIRAAVGSPVRPQAAGTTAAVASFEDAATLEIAPDALVTVPAGSVPAVFAAALFAYEAALHAADLAHALGADTVLSADELAAAETVLGPLLDLVAERLPAEPVTIDLIGSGHDIRLSADPSTGTWTRSVPVATEPATTTITGSREQIVLFVSGRIGAEALQVTGVGEHAERFKTYFPGP